METQSLENAEYILLGAGTALLLAGCCAAAARGRLRAVLKLDSGPKTEVQSTDVLIAFAAILMFPGLIDSILGSILGTPTLATTLPASGAEPDLLRRSGSVLMGQICASIVILVLGRERFGGSLRAWGLEHRGFALRAGQALLAYVCIWPVCYGILVATVWTLERAFPSFELPEHESIALLIGPDASKAVRAVTISSALVMAAIQEELFFRGILQQWLRGMSGSAWTSIVITSCAFGLFHWPLFHTMPALAVFGSVLGFLYFKTGSLTLVILLHAAFNGKTLLWIALGAQA